ncbi:DUF624 domain-containing protein [Paenibacillus sp. PR3]|uniref:DUF624 domain-containing protein n=1 Tax=Paenibacillus terricola TaxID=2763503 RepID=A0ABR8MXB1_9BACL|nr:DUF624 domain-containing protein [Paenibacillus terricola]MBD3919545.1 DUF624 domain-containing protein [Paenibacillus terricola]
MEMKGLMGGFYRISEWIMRLAVTNVLWAVCSIPFLFMVLSAVFFATDAATQTSMLIVAAILAPFTLFPATAALYTLTRKWVMGEVDVPLLKTFFRGYKENYKQSMLGGLLYAALYTIIFVDFKVYWNQPSMQLISYLFVGFLFVLLVSMFNFFSMMVHYHMKTMQLIKNALLISIGRPFRSISTLIMACVVFYISLRFTFLFPFFTASIIGYISFWNFNFIYQKMQEQMEKQRAAAEQAEEASDEGTESDDLVHVTGKK